MKKSTKRIAAYSTAFLMVLSSGTAGIFNNELNLFSNCSTVCYAGPTTIYSGSDSADQINLNDNNVIIYVKLDKNTKKAELCGSKITGEQNVTVPNTITKDGITYSVKSIGKSAFEHQDNLKTFNIAPLSESRSETVYPKLDYIGEKAFRKCLNLSISNVESEIIKSQAYDTCEKLETVSLTKTSQICDSAFIYCKSLRYVKYNGRYLDENAFKNCTGLEILDLSESEVRSIKEGAFKGCSSLKNIEFGSYLKSIGYQSFYGIGAESIFLPENLEGIGDEAFRECKNLKNVFTPAILKEIGRHCFFDCTSMKYFVCENNILDIGYKAIGYYRNEAGQSVQMPGFVIWGDTKQIENRSQIFGKDLIYANNSGITYKLKSEAAKEAINNRTENSNARYHIYNNQWYLGTPTYYRVNSPFTSISNGIEKEKYSGSCYGMSALLVLVQNGYIKNEEITKIFLNKRENTNVSTKIQSLINTFQGSSSSMGFLPSVCDYSTDRNYNEGTNVFNKRMLKYIEYITYGADSGILCYNFSTSNYSGAHAVVCDGIEFKKYSDSAKWRNDTLGIQPNARILIYDVNDISKSEPYYIYVNTNTGKWFAQTTDNISINYQQKDTRIQLNYSIENMFDRYITGMTSKEFIDKALDIFTNG